MNDDLADSCLTLMKRDAKLTPSTIGAAMLQWHDASTGWMLGQRPDILAQNRLRPCKRRFLTYIDDSECAFRRRTWVGLTIEHRPHVQ